jgi:hypothetical protein
MKEIRVRVYGRWMSYTYETEQRNLVIALSRAGRELRGREDGGDLSNVLYKSNHNCHYESPHIRNIF